MKIIVLNGSPKGKHSITLQYVHFLQKQFPQHELKIIHISKEIKKIENDDKTFNEIIDEIRSTDGIIWSFGLWVLAVPAQYMRFIELISEKGVEDAFKNKYTAALSTSIHYYDHTAHNYMRSICEDFNMKYVEGISFDILDLRKAKERNHLCFFAETFFNDVQSRTITSRLFTLLSFSSFVYKPTASRKKIAVGKKKVLVLTDEYNSNTNIKNMIDRFRQAYSDEIELINLNDIDIRGACIGCMRCGYDYTCQYRDGFTEFYNTRVRTADIIVFAGCVKGRYLSSKWKTFYDRAFFWSHTPSLEGKQLAYIISGPMRQNENLVQILEANITARQNANFVDIITDESEDSEIIDAQLQNLAERLIRFSEKEYVKPHNFLAIGGHKVFRDNIWGRLRGVWQADHSYYKKNGLYDFPHKNLMIRIFNTVLLTLTKIPGIRKKYYDNIKYFPAKRYEKLIERIGIEA